MNKNKIIKQHRNLGFTLVEIMVSVAIFTVIMVTGIGALVSVTSSYQTSQKNKQVNDALNYTLETMTREIRLGRNYHAGADINTYEDPFPSDGLSSSLGFTATDNRGYMLLSLEDGIIYRRRYFVGGGSSRDALTNSSQVFIENLDFDVMGTEGFSDGDTRQPRVLIRIQATSPGSGDDVVASAIQTLVSQRILDV